MYANGNNAKYGTLLTHCYQAVVVLPLIDLRPLGIYPRKESILVYWMCYKGVGPPTFLLDALQGGRFPFLASKQYNYKAGH